MPTQVDITVNAGGGADWTTLQDAVDDITTAATGADLVTNDENVVISIESNLTESGIICDEALTTDVTRNVIITGDIKTDGTESGTGRTITGATIFRCRDDHVILEDLRLTQNGSWSPAYSTGSTGSPVGCGVRRCVFEATAANAYGIFLPDDDAYGSSSYPVIIKNCAFYGFGTAIGIHQWGSGTSTGYADIVNITIALGTTAGNADRGVWVAGGTGGNITLRIYNVFDARDSLTSGILNAYVNSGTATVTVTGGNNVTDAWAAASDYPSGTLEASDPYDPTTSLSPGAGTFAIYSSDTDATLVDDADNDALDVGVGPSSQALVDAEDIEGNARAGTTCDPGCFQVTAISGGGGVPFSMSATIRRNVRL